LALLGRPEQRLRSICPPLWLMTRSLCSIEANLSQAAATTSAIDASRASIGMIGQLSESCPAAIPRTGYNHFKRAKPAKVGHVPKSFFRKVYIKHYCNRFVVGRRQNAKKHFTFFCLLYFVVEMNPRETTRLHNCIFVFLHFAIM
jgi:hypothetical protein